MKKEKIMKALQSTDGQIIRKFLQEEVERHKEEYFNIDVVDNKSMMQAATRKGVVLGLQYLEEIVTMVTEED